jgi:hypothetical protein
MRNDVILHQLKGCRVTYFDVVAMRRDAMTSRSSSEDSGVMEPVARRLLCKHAWMSQQYRIAMFQRSPTRSYINRTVDC